MAEISAAQLELLRRAHEGDVYVFRDTVGRPGGGIHKRTLAALTQAGLIRQGSREPQGYPLIVTTKGIAVLSLLADSSREG